MTRTDPECRRTQDLGDFLEFNAERSKHSADTLDPSAGGSPALGTWAKFRAETEAVIWIRLNPVRPSAPALVLSDV